MLCDMRQTKQSSAYMRGCGPIYTQAYALARWPLSLAFMRLACAVADAMAAAPCPPDLSITPREVNC